MTARNSRRPFRTNGRPRRVRKRHALPGMGGVIALALAASAPAAVAEEFSGVYAGPEAGYVWSKDNVIGKADGAYFGGFLGARDQLPGGFVYGAEFSAGGSTQDKTFMATEFDSGRFVAVDAVLGVSVQDRFLLFGNLGYQNFKLRGERDGLRYGGGIEVPLSAMTSARVKVNYSNFDGIKTVTSNAGLLVRF